MKSIVALMFLLFVTAYAQTNETSESSESSGDSSSDSSEEGTNQLRVGIYYNSLCADTASFIVNQLLPAYENLKEHIDLFFVPFGKAYRVDHGDYFICQFGPDECFGNMLQSCGLHQICRDEQSQVDFVACEMRWPFNRNVTRPECSELAGISWDDVTDCIENGLGRQLQFEAERITHRVAFPYPDFVPTIVYNNTFDQELQDRSLREFATVICELIDNADPSCVDEEEIET